MIIQGTIKVFVMDLVSIKIVLRTFSSTDIDSWVTFGIGTQFLFSDMLMFSFTM